MESSYLICCSLICLRGWYPCRRIFCYASIFTRGLYVYFYRLYWLGHSQFLVRISIIMALLHCYGKYCSGLIFPRICNSPLEFCQIRRSAQTFTTPRHRYRYCWAKGLPETKLLFKYPFRVAINPIVSTIGWTLPNLVNGELLTSLVLGLPTIAPIFLGSLLMQDMYLAGSIVFILSMLTVIGTLISDILLAWVDPRIREAI